MTSIPSKDGAAESRPGEAAGVSVAARSEIGGSLIRNVDLCRGLFAFLVVGAHAFDVCWVIHPDAIAALPEGFRHVLFYTVQGGFYWVMGFFVVSGYCIQLSAGRQVESGRFSLGVYLAARLTRIMPLYYVGLLFALAIEVLVANVRPSFYPEGVDSVGWVSQLVFAQRFTRTFGAFAPSWTITYELFYYLFFGLLAVSFSGSRVRPARYGMLLCILIGGSMQWFYANGVKNPFTLHVGLIFGLGCVWFMGALIAVQGPALVRHRAARVLAMTWPLVFGLAVFLRADGRCPLQVIYLVLGVAFTLMILQFQAIDARRNEVRDDPRWLARTAKLVGLASYPTYLFHGPLLLLIASAISHGKLIDDWRLSWLVLTVSGIGFGVFLGWFVERPIMAWRAGWLASLKESSSKRSETRPRPLLEIQR